jgi:23S rRNA (uridine2552-2'-O)-methyltransferase
MNWWQSRQKNDPFVKKRQKEGVTSRSYFKLEEIDKKFHICYGKVLDIGAAPGGWTEYLSRKCKSVVAVDILPIQVWRQNILFFQQDIKEFQSDEVFDAIFSDIAPNLSGNLLVDSAFMEQMVTVYCDLLKNLKSDGSLVFKNFQWESSELSTRIIRPYFKKMKVFKPKSSRKSSAEIYLVFQNKI